MTSFRGGGAGHHGGGGPPLILMVAEKPSIAGSIASVLSGGQHQTRGGKLPVHEFPGSFRGRECIFRVTSVTGHVYSMDFPA